MVLVTGASGFLGQYLCRTLLAQGRQVAGMVFSKCAEKKVPPGVWPVRVGDFGGELAWEEILDGIDVVVHLAARVPGSKGITSAEFLRVNAEGTIKLARAAAHAGVRRFIFLSSAHVQGPGRAEPYREDDPLAPLGPYAESKAIAEAGLLEVSAQTRLETVTLRPPIVYGPGAKGKIFLLLQWVYWGLPLPWVGGAPRSMLFVGNLVDAVAACLTAPSAGGKTFLLRDGEDIAFPQLIQRMAMFMDRKARLIPVRQGTMVGNLLGLNRLSTAIRVDDTLIRRTLGWQPPISCDYGLEQTVRWFLQERR